MKKGLKFYYPAVRPGMIDIFVSETPVTIGRDKDGKVVVSRQDRTSPNWNFNGDDESFRD